MRVRPAVVIIAVVVAVLVLVFYSRRATAPEAPPQPGGSNVRHVQIKMKNFAFEPSEVTVPVGAIIDWIDMEGKHGVVFDGSGVADDPKDVFEVGGSLSRTFSMPGRYLYHCPAHGGAGGRGMYGVVIVSGGG